MKIQRHNISWRAFAVRFACAILLLAGCGRSTRPLTEYSAYNATERIILPHEYADYLRNEKFTHGELDHLPSVAIILHHDDVEAYLRELGYSKWQKLQTGETDPNVMFIVRVDETGKHDFIVNRGLPGAGGITTQAAELAALGVKQIIHIGTAGFVGSELPDRAIVVSSGSIKDGAAVMLSDDPLDRVSRPSRALMERVASDAAKRGVALSRGVGYTSPIFYLQPSGIIHQIIRERSAVYVEMEGAPLFELAHRMNFAAASIVIGSDRYALQRDGKLKHDYFESTREQEMQALRIAIDALTRRD